MVAVHAVVLQLCCKGLARPPLGALLALHYGRGLKAAKRWVCTCEIYYEHALTTDARLSLCACAGASCLCFARRARVLKRTSTTLPIGLEIPEQRSVTGTFVGVRIVWTDWTRGYPRISTPFNLFF